MARLLTAADIDTADPRKLAKALRRECNKKLRLIENIGRLEELEMLPTTLLAVLSNAPALPATPPDDDYLSGVWDRSVYIIRAAARAWLAAGGTLEMDR